MTHMPIRIHHKEASARLIRAEKKIKTGHYGSALRDIAVAFYASLGYYGIHLEENPTSITGNELLRFWIRKFNVDAKRFSRFELISPAVRFNFDLQRFEPTKEQKTYMISKKDVQFCYDFTLLSLVGIENAYERIMGSLD